MDTESWVMYLLGAICGGLLGAAIATTTIEAPKRACEETLPRNVECVWAAPEVGNE